MLPRVVDGLCDEPYIRIGSQGLPGGRLITKREASAS